MTFKKPFAATASTFFAYICGIGLCLAAGSSSKTLTSNLEYTKIVPTELHLQPEKYPVFEIQFPITNGGTTNGYSDFEIKASITNFDNEATVLTKNAQKSTSTHQKVDWMKVSTEDEFKLKEGDIDPSKKPEGFDKWSCLDKHAWAFAHTGAYFYFFGSLQMYVSRFEQHRNDGSINAYLNATYLPAYFKVQAAKAEEAKKNGTSVRAAASTVGGNSPFWDARRYVKFFVPDNTTDKYKLWQATKKTTTSSRINTLLAPGFSTVSGSSVAATNNDILEVPLDKANQGSFGIGEAYTGQGSTTNSSRVASSALSSTGMTTGKTSSVLVFLNYRPSDQVDAKTHWIEKVFSRACELYLLPTNPELKFCYILCNKSGWEMNGSAQRIYRSITPSKWVIKPYLDNSLILYDEQLSKSTPATANGATAPAKK